MYNPLSTYIIILLYNLNIKILLIVNLKYVDSSKISIFDGSNNYTFLSDSYRIIFFC